MQGDRLTFLSSERNVARRPSDGKDLQQRARSRKMQAMQSSNNPFASCSVVLLVQLNDLYHIDTSADYTDPDSLILPRISTLVARLRADYGSDNVRFCVPGDFLAPSCLSKEFHGEQMVDVLNTMGIDLVSLGNHEFEPDLREEDLAKRIDESRFKWLNANFAFHNEALEDRFHIEGKMTPIETISASDSHRIFVFGVLGTETPDHVGEVLDQAWAIEAICDAGREAVDEAAQLDPPRHITTTYVAMTHQTIEEDLSLAKAFPALSLIMGGHDHNVVQRSWADRCLIVKTASNARTLRLNWIVTVPEHASDGSPVPDSSDPERFEAFSKQLFFDVARPLRDALLQTRKPTPEQVIDLLEVHDLDPEHGQPFEITSRMVGKERVFIFSLGLATDLPAFTRLVPPDPSVSERIRHWNARCKHSSDAIVAAPIELILLDSVIRRASTNFGNFVADIVRGVPLLAAGPHRIEAEIGLINSGGFRLDRNISAGEGISERTLCDIFFHSNEVRCFTLSGAALVNILMHSLELRSRDPLEGDGNFLQISGLRVKAANTSAPVVIRVDDFGTEEPIDPGRLYSVATTTYVAIKAFSGGFVGAHSAPLDRDLKEAVRNALRRVDPAVFALVLTSAARWEF